ncbi:alkaline phosphatase family protein [Arthrobacter sp. LAPM80]|uniref:alkaline phosphatase family protein n=1 Tax=Arthrobacter sp. LAPM80 TaxID=3141788 RepID=UPI00398B2754
MLDAQGEQQLIVAGNRGTGRQPVQVLTVAQPLDDTVFAARSGQTLWVSDPSNTKVYSLTALSRSGQAISTAGSIQCRAACGARTTDRRFENNREELKALFVNEKIGAGKRVRAAGTTAPQGLHYFGCRSGRVIRTMPRSSAFSFSQWRGVIAMSRCDCGWAGCRASEGRGDDPAPIKHVVVIFQENVSFHHYFATYPKVDNTPGETLQGSSAAAPAFTAAKKTPHGINTLANAGLLAPNNPNSIQPARLTPMQAVTCDQDRGYTVRQSDANGVGTVIGDPDRIPGLVPVRFHANHPRNRHRPGVVPAHPLAPASPAESGHAAYSDPVDEQNFIPPP